MELVTKLRNSRRQPRMQVALRDVYHGLDQCEDGREQRDSARTIVERTFHRLRLPSRIMFILS